MMILNFFRFNRNIKTFSAGEFIFQAGDYGDEMYVVQEGIVELQLGTEIIEVVKTGGILGEMVMIGKPPHTITAVASTNCQLVVVKANQFRDMVQETPYFAEWVLCILVVRVMKINEIMFPAEFNYYMGGR